MSELASLSPRIQEILARPPKKVVIPPEKDNSILSQGEKSAAQAWLLVRFTQMLADPRFPPDKNKKLALGDPQYYDFQCRGNWWTKLINYLSTAVDRGLVSRENTKQAIAEFLQFCKTIKWGEFRTDSELDQADLIMKKVIVDLRVSQPTKAVKRKVA